MTESNNRKDTLIMIAFSIVGAGISVLSFFLYHYFNHVLVTTMLCIADAVFAYFNAKLFLQSKDWNGACQIFIPIMLLVYWVVVFAVICAGNAMMLSGEFLNHFFFYPVFLMPSFVVVVLLLVGILMGL